MSTVNAFAPNGNTFVVSTSSVQITTNNNVSAISYRVRNLTASTAYFRWAPALPNGEAVTVGAVTTPVAGTPSINTFGMFPDSVEVFTLPPNVWMQSDTADAFEVTPGEGI